MPFTRLNTTHDFDESLRPDRQAQKTGGARVSPAQPQQNASLPVLERRIMLLSSGCSI
jgi:hypothetical protein